jgi:histidinol-phosphate/aromatic aminotransferase/cobyric acid decarboxylase-like protein
MNARVPLTEETRERLKDFVRGLGADDYDSAINFLLDFIKKNDEAETLAGFRLRDEYDRQQKKGKK